MLRRFNFNRLAHFVAIVDAGTITGAAKNLGLSKAVVSKQLQLLEEDVGTPLLHRNTRHMSPTAAGRLFYESAKSAINQANNAYESIQERDNQPKGILRITSPVDFGVSYLSPFVARFQTLYPDVTFELSFRDSIVDIIEDRFDLAFRIGWLTDSANLAKKLGDWQEIAICSPQTYEQLNVHSPKDLEHIPFARSHVFSGKSEWTFNSGKKSQSIDISLAVELNVTLALKTYVTAGFCFTILPDFLVRRDLQQGSLVRILPDWQLRNGSVYTVTQANRIRSNALRLFLDMVHRKDQQGIWSVD